MRFARLQSDGVGSPLGIEELVGSARLDYLQLDYPRPRSMAIAGADPPELPEHAVGFGDALRAVVKPLYLDPQLHLVASAGWADAYTCVEAAAAVMVEAGCGDMPMAAVRGSNLLPILDMLEGEGVNLDHAETGARWRELRSPVLAADLQLGAGPLAVALAEHARIVIAGSFDGRAPMIAAAVHAFGWKWHEHDRLAAAAAGSRAASWIDWDSFADGGASGRWRPNWIELDGDGRIIVEPATADERAAARLQQWLREGEGASAEVACSDVREERTSLACGLVGPGQLSVADARGHRDDDCWLLEILYESGFSVEAMIEFSPHADPRWRRHLATVARHALDPGRDDEGLMTIDELHLVGDSGAGWLHVAYQAKTQAECQHVAEQVVKLAAAHHPHARLASGRPMVHVHFGLWPVRVPRDAVDVAVETRLAREWL